MIYLAAPYSHAQPTIQEMRFRALCRQAAELVRCGVVVLSPVIHCHPIAVTGGLRGDWAFWKPSCLAFLEHCDSVLVLKLPGWEKSTGVKAEIKRAKELGKPVYYAEPRKDSK